MGGPSAEERAELERLRDQVAARIEYLDDQVSYGVMTLEQKDRLLQEEFGTGYQETLQLLNSLIHHSSHTHRLVPHASFAAILLAVLAVVGILAALIYPGITGAVVADGRTINLDVIMQHQDRQRIPATGPAAIMDIERLYEGEGDYVLEAIHAEGTLRLASGDAMADACTGCGVAIRPPIMLELRTTGGQLRIGEVVMSP